METRCAAALFSRIAASKLHRDLPARRTKGYKAFANDMIRELFRVPPFAHPRDTYEHLRAYRTKVATPKKILHFHLYPPPILFFY